MPKPTLKNRIAARIAMMTEDVIMRSDFSDLAGYRQVGDALTSLVRDRHLLKYGHGLYVRCQVSPFDGKPAPVVGVKRLTIEALRRLGVETTATTMERNYNRGQSTQVPTGRVVGVRKRVRRQLGYGNVRISLEYVPKKEGGDL